MQVACMEFRLAVLFLFLYYIRPQDWVPGMAGFNIIRPMIIAWVWALMSAKARSPVQGLLKTPHDWAMLAYWLWVAWTGPDIVGALTSFFSLVVFYVLTLHSLTSWDRVLGYLKAWNGMLVGVALMALGSLVGFDLTDARSITAINEGRLCIGTWMHNNPNALGHSLAVVPPLSYMLYFWRGGSVGKFVLFPLASVIALACIYETQSKGSFLVSACLMVMIFVIGRPFLVKAFVLSMAATLGVSALSFLPRMSDMGNLRADEGVQGRLMAWELAKTAMEKAPAGWKQFTAYINWYGEIQPKATHSSYVQVGADLGIAGMFFYLLALWVGVRGLITAGRFTRQNDDEERCRRMVLLLLVAYSVSGWMINRTYHTEYFLLVAVAASVHRLYLARLALADGSGNAVSPANEPQSPHAPAEGAVMVPALSREDEEVSLPFPPRGISRLASGWSRIGIGDAAMAGAWTWLTLEIWDYVLVNL